MRRARIAGAGQPHALRAGEAQGAADAPGPVGWAKAAAAALLEHCHVPPCPRDRRWPRGQIDAGAAALIVEVPIRKPRRDEPAAQINHSVFAPTCTRISPVLPT